MASIGLKSSPTVLTVLKQIPVVEEGVELGHLLRVDVFTRDLNRSYR